LEIELFTPKLKIRACREGAILPEIVDKTSLFNIHANFNKVDIVKGFKKNNVFAQMKPIDGIIEIPSGCRVLVPTGLFLNIPQGYYVSILPNTNLFWLKGLDVVKQVVVSKEAHEIELFVTLVNTSDNEAVVSNEDCICIGLFQKFEDADIEVR
jgi:dUTPase